MADAILVLNAGSSSLKFSVFLEGGSLSLLFRAQVEGLSTDQPRFKAKDAHGQLIGERVWDGASHFSHEQAVEYLFQWGQQGPLHEHRLAAAGHRIVHGGQRFTGPVRIDADTLAELEKLVPLAPLHQPHNLAAIRAVRRHAPDLPQVACFDTSFHRTQPTVARAFALPRLYAEHGVCRYGFHGISYEYIASVLPDFDAKAAASRTIVAHLGNGASLCALAGGRSAATTMGLTPLDGLMMGTRSGSLDPGAILYLLSQPADLSHESSGQPKLDVDRLQNVLYNQSGLLGVSGISSDMRTLLASTDPRAAEAIDLFVYRVAREIGSMAAALGGVDALVFTGGIGENAAPIRARVCRDAAWLGVELDEAANARGGPSITRPKSPTAAWVIPTNEELMIARHTEQLVGRRS